MRGLIGITLVLAVLWGGWWLVGSRGVEATAVRWFAEQAAAGREARYEALAVRGFPSRFDLTVTGPSLADPAAGIGWRAPFAQVFAMSWKPWHLIAALPGGQVFTLPGQEVTLDADRMMASLLLVPGSDLALSEAVIEGDALGLAPPLGGLQGVDRAVASIRADDTRRNGYRLGLALSALALDPGFRTGIAPLVEAVRLDATIALSAPLDRKAGQVTPGLRLIDLRELRIDWGAMKVFGKGEMTRDGAGYAAGRIEFRVENWRLLPPVLAAFGIITPEFAPVLERGLEVMARQKGDPSALVLSLVAEGGQISLGPLPLGPAPYWE